MKKDIFRRISSLISTALLFIIASYIPYILIRILIVFIISIIFYILFEILEIKIYKESEFFDHIKEWRTEKDHKQLFVNIVTLLFLPILQTLFIIILEYFISPS